MTRSQRVHLISSAAALFTAITIFSSCIKEESYPIIPEIEYQGLERIFYDTSEIATTGILAFSFQDGDGDLGLNPRDTFPPYNRNGEYYYNLVIRYYEKHDSGYVEKVLNPPYSARFPVLNPDYPDKPIKGLIVDTLSLDPSPDFDTVRFEFFIYDRALHKSNVVTTPDIVLRRSR